MGSKQVIAIADIGVDYMKVTNEGLNAGYKLGRKAGMEFMKSGRIEGAMSNR